MPTTQRILADDDNRPPIEWSRALFDAIDDAVLVHDFEGRIVEANPAACRRLGYTRDELLNLSTRDIDAAEFGSGFRDRLGAQRTAGTFRCEGIHIAKDGRRIVVDINTSLVRLGDRPGVLAVMRDITERRREDEARERQRRLWQSILDGMGEAVVVADADANVVLTNPAASRLFPGGIQPTLAPREHDSPLDVQPLERCIRGESFDNLELFVPASPLAGDRWVSLTGRPLRDVDGAARGGVLVGHDITLRKMSERHRGIEHDVARTLAESVTLEGAATAVLRDLCLGLDFDIGVLWMVDDARRELGCVEIWHRPGGEWRELVILTRKSRLRPGIGVPGQVCLSGEPVFERLESSNDDFDRVGLASQAGLSGVSAFPIKQGSTTVGVIEFFSGHRLVQDDAFRGLMTALGSQLGQVLQRQRMEKALRDSEALFESLVESLPHNVFRKDLEGRFVFANQRFCRTVKKPLREILGKSDFDLFPIELASKYVADDAHILETGEALDVVEEHRTPDGRRLYVQVVKTTVVNAVGDVVGVQGLFWDVTERTLAEELRTVSERRYRQLAEATLDGIVLVDDQGLILLFNPAAERMFGYDAAEVVGRPATLLAPVDLREEHERERLHYLETRESSVYGRPVEMRLLRKDGTEFPCEVATSALSTGEPGAPVQFLAAIRDLTERNKMRSHLVQNEKLASIGLLSAGVAHEINNPLAFVSNNLVVLQRDGLGLLELVKIVESEKEALAQALPDLAAHWRAKAEEIDVDYLAENLARLLGRTRDGVDRVTRIVQSLRGLARTDSPRRQTVNLCDLIDSSLEIIKGKYKRSGIETTQDHPEPPMVECVSTQISQVILNLLVNAFQAVESTGKEGGLVAIRSRLTADKAILEIEDNGPGIVDDVVPRVFDPFFTTKDVGEGTGLGLSISHHIVSAHGGQLEVDGNPGRGACFRVILPLTHHRSSS